jgi:WD40 repeat protein
MFGNRDPAWIHSKENRTPQPEQYDLAVLGSGVGGKLLASTLGTLDRSKGLAMHSVGARFAISCGLCVSVYGLAGQCVNITASAAQDPRVAVPPAVVNPAEPDQNQIVRRWLTPVRLVDARGKPVEGATVAESFTRDDDRESIFTPMDPKASWISNDQGDVLLQLKMASHLEETALFAIRKRNGRPLVGIQAIKRENIGKPMTMTMYPACRVLFQIESVKLATLEQRFNAELTGPGWRRCADLRTSGAYPSRVLSTSSSRGSLEFLAPPGRFKIVAYGDDAKSTGIPLEVKPDDRELVIGTIDLDPSDKAMQGVLPHHRRVNLGDGNGDDRFVWRRVQRRSLKGDLRGVQDASFSPDGKMLATAHAHSFSPSEVKLWDWASGAQLANIPSGERRIETLAFSPDGKSLYGIGDARGAASGIVVWDVAARRETRLVGGSVRSMQAIATSHDGQTLASSGADEKTYLWDFASGREMARIADFGTCPRSLAVSSRDNVLAIGNGRTINLWDTAHNRLQLTLQPEADRFVIGAITFSPDGRTLAAAGVSKSQAQVRLYDIANDRIRRRAICGFERLAADFPENQPSLCSDLVFTPDGRRLIAVAGRHIKTWDTVTAVERDTFKQISSTGPSDRLAVSPDGHWLAIVRPLDVSFLDIPSGR